LPLLFLLFVAIATGALAAHAGRDEVRQSAEPIWRMESFLAYALFVGLVLLPTTIYFYAFHGDWFLFYWVDTSRAPWIWGMLATLLLVAAALVGFRLGAAFCRAARDQAARRATVGVLLFAFAVWPLAWTRLSVVGSHRQFARSYGLIEFFASPAFYSGLTILVIGGIAFASIVVRITRQTQQKV
jgi:hypothetical protein